MAIASDALPEVIHVAAEHADLVHTGGLGEVMAGLPPAQAALGASVRILLPGHRAAVAALGAPATPGPSVHLPWGTAHFVRHDGVLEGVPVTLLGEPDFFDREHVYGPPGGGYDDNPVRFSAFCQAAVQLIRDTARRPTIVHLHDWHVGLMAALLLHEPRLRTVMTVHNLAYQGAFPAAALDITGIDPSLATFDGVLHWGQINPMKAGLQLAHAVTTVSPTYAKEIQREENGCGLAPLLRYRASDLVGIVNGIRGDEDPPEAETRPARRAALCAEMGIELPKGPLFGVVSRLTDQKGLDLLAAALPAAVAQGAGAVVVGTGDRPIAEALHEVAAAHPTRIAFFEGFDTQLAARVFAASDVVCVPSRFEPCGMAQLHAMRAGALPLVRATGGLVDTVVDVGSMNGFGIVFDDATVEALTAALLRAIELFGDRRAWSAAVARAISRPVGWDVPAARYLELYARTLRGA